MKTNKIQSLRTCLYCNKQYPKHDLIRFVKINNNLIIDKTHKMQGRGYYLKITSEALNDPKLIQIISKRTHTHVSDELIKELKQ